MTCGGNGGLSLWKYEYPAARSAKADDGVAAGVAGTLSMVHSSSVATQPVSSLDWHGDKVWYLSFFCRYRLACAYPGPTHPQAGLCAVSAFDQSLRVCVVTNLNTL